ncbi:hypothetical protein GGE66_005594 [Rhizobium leguminosarum]|uniref:Uncharacterized protein n=1 Tax=Rhizobium leguminosarum TaxID=384 RepID=A0A7X0DW98_RHILE|nr:hypothetical protein [Rhizobium leguminosarum]
MRGRAKKPSRFPDLNEAGAATLAAAGFKAALNL